MAQLLKFSEKMCIHLTQDTFKMGGLKALYSHCFLSLGFGDFRGLFIHLSQEAHKFLLKKHEEKRMK